VTAPALELQDLTVDFGSVRALTGVTATVAGGPVGLLGRNGAGKSTLIRTLLGLVRPASGRAKLYGFDSAHEPLPIRHRVGYMPERDCFVPGLSGLRLVAFAGELSALPPLEALRRAHEVLYYVGLEEQRYRPAHTYSAGMKQRLKLALALVHDPPLLFLDEPTNGLDPRGRREMLDLIRDLAKRGKDLVVSTHLLPDVEYVCRDVLMLDRGRTVAQGPIQELCGNDQTIFQVEVRGDRERFRGALAARGLAPLPDRDGPPGRPSEIALPADVKTSVLFQAAADAGVQVRRLRSRRRTLEETFLDLVGNA
jgi:ABC-2 type transport system ATP-binding protein